MQYLYVSMCLGSLRTRLQQQCHLALVPALRDNPRQQSNPTARDLVNLPLNYQRCNPSRPYHLMTTKVHGLADLFDAKESTTKEAKFIDTRK